MSNKAINGPKSKDDSSCGSTGVNTTQPSGNLNGPTDSHSKPMCKCCGKQGTDFRAAPKKGQKVANAYASPVYVVIATNTEDFDFVDWIVAIYESEQDAVDHCNAAQAVADKIYEEYQSGLLKEDDLLEIENEFDPNFEFDYRGVDYVIEGHALFKSGPGFEALMRWVAKKRETFDDSKYFRELWQFIASKNLD